MSLLSFAALQKNSHMTYNKGMKLNLAYYGDPILRKKAARVDHIDDELRQFVADMIETMVESGMGLAAPQVKRSIALFVAMFPVEDPDGKFRYSPPQVFINPKILAHSEETWTEDEGCLSIPKLRGDVTRPLKISIEATDLDGNHFTAELVGWPARVFLHENDHLNGVLYIDRMDPKKRKEIEPKLREIKRTYGSKSA